MKHPVDWSSDESELLLNPQLKASDRRFWQSALPKDLPAHVWLLSSGSRSDGRLIALAKSAILANAERVNRHLQATQKDCWLNALPSFHIGGLSIYARAYLLQNKIYELKKWRPKDFVQHLKRYEATLSALVPTQVYDLVENGLQAPPSLRAVIVGGGRITPSLYRQGRELGWPLLPSFGMTEASSQIATAELSSLNSTELPALRILSGWHVRLDHEQRMLLHGAGLMTGHLQKSGQKSGQKSDAGLEWRRCKPKEYKSQDRVMLNDGYLTPLGRVDDLVKIRGELVDLAQLQKWLEQEMQTYGYVDRVFVVPIPDARAENEIYIFTDLPPKDLSESKIENFKRGFPPYAQPQGVFYLAKLPRSELGKLRWQSLLKSIGMACVAPVTRR